MDSDIKRLIERVNALKKYKKNAKKSYRDLQRAYDIQRYELALLKVRAIKPGARHGVIEQDAA